MRRAVAVCACMILAVPGGAVPVQAEEDYPDRAIRLVIPFGPGGATDVLFRRVADWLETSLDTPIDPVNVSGDAAIRGARDVKEATPDGYTLLGSHQTLSLSYLYGKADFSYEAFAPVALLMRTINIPATRADHPVDAADGIAPYVAKHGDNVRFGMIEGSTDHFFWLHFFEEAGIDQDQVALVGYPDTASQIAALMTGEIDFSMLNLPSGGELFASGTLTPLGVADTQRLSTLPSVPTLQEQGIDMVNTTDRGLFAPLGTPIERRDVLVSALLQVLDDDMHRQRLEREFGTRIHVQSSGDYSRVLDEQFRRLEELAKAIDFD